MHKQKRLFPLGTKIYLFVLFIVLFAAIGTGLLSYFINVNQIDRYYKRLTLNSARTSASLVDVGFLKQLKEVAESEEYQKLRDQAEEAEDESLIEEYLKSKGLWEKYEEQREFLRQYVKKMEDTKYLYAIVWGGNEEQYDMYLIDSDDVPLYETGYFEEREEEFSGVDASGEIDPVISDGDWGWLCSGYAPVYDDDGNLVCHIGCDIGMEEVIEERNANFDVVLIAVLILTLVILVVAFLLIHKSVVKPLEQITEEMKKFTPAENSNYKDAGVINLEIRRNDEIGDIYREIHTMQVKIIDYINDITVMQEDRKKVEDDIRNKEMVIGEIRKEAYVDPLTGIGNKNSYKRTVNRYNAEMENGNPSFAVVMVDANCLKIINDSYGHIHGDDYLKGCCHMICETFKHSPVFRIGGDEFVAVLSGDDYNDRDEKVKELKKKFENTYNNDDADPWLKYSAAVGMAVRMPEDTDMEQVFRRADKNMYEEKLRFKDMYGIAARNSENDEEDRNDTLNEDS